MKKRKILWVALLMIFAFSAHAQNKKPYLVRGQITATATSYFFEGVFSNKSSKEVENFTIVFFVLDQDGNSPLKRRNNVVLRIQESVPPAADFYFTKGLNEYFNESEDYSDEVEYECEYLYVSRIEYSDETEWSDPFGFDAF